MNPEGMGPEGVGPEGSDRGSSDVAGHEDQVADLDDELAATEGRFTGELRALLTPGAGINRRTAESVDRALRSRSTGTAALELLGVGWQTLRLFLSDDPSGADLDRGGLWRSAPPPGTGTPDTGAGGAPRGGGER